MVKKRLKPNLFNDEISRLERVIKKIGDGSTIDSSLKNYFVYRLVGIYEIKVYDTLKRQIDEDNPYKTTYGAAILDSGTTHTKYIEENIATMLKHKSYGNVDYKIKCEPHFFDVFNAIFEINSPLKENFGKLSKNNFTYLIKNLLDSRNIMTHNMRDVTYTKNQLNSILQLMRIFLYAFPFVYKLVESVILKKHELSEQIHLQSNEVLTSNLNCSLIPLDEIIDVIDKIIYFMWYCVLTLAGQKPVKGLRVVERWCTWYTLILTPKTSISIDVHVIRRFSVSVQIFFSRFRK